MTDTAPHDHKHYVPSLYTVFACLLLLLVATVVVAYIDLGVFALPVALGIAITKAGLILAYFMHLVHEKSLVRVFAFAGFASLAILLIILLADVNARHKGEAALRRSADAVCCLNEVTCPVAGWRATGEPRLGAG